VGKNGGGNQQNPNRGVPRAGSKRDNNRTGNGGVAAWRSNTKEEKKQIGRQKRKEKHSRGIRKGPKTAAAGLFPVAPVLDVDLYGKTRGFPEGRKISTMGGRGPRTNDLPKLEKNGWGAEK